MDRLNLLRNDLAAIRTALAKAENVRTTTERVALETFQDNLDTYLEAAGTNIDRSFLDSIKDLRFPRPAINTRIASANLPTAADVDSQNPALEDDIVNLNALSGSVDFVCQAPDELSPEQKQLVTQHFKMFFAKKVFGLQSENELSTKMWANAFASLCISISEKWTSKTNASNPDTHNSFKVDNRSYDWTQKALWDYINSVNALKPIPNVLRRYGRTCHETIKRTLNEINYVPSGRLAAKNGSVSNYRKNITDFTPSYKEFSTAEEQSSALATKDYAITKSGMGKTIVHTAQIVGNTRR
uniref:Coat protein n=1 Tax=Areca yellow-leaf-disease associated virus TaxID=2707181 RepID=A0A6C0N9F0_9CLOS|nr:coat protein [Areca yellow-leaf-disease associated virus]